MDFLHSWYAFLAGISLLAIFGAFSARQNFSEGLNDWAIAKYFVLGMAVLVFFVDPAVKGEAIRVVCSAILTFAFLHFMGKLQARWSEKNRDLAQPSSPLLR
jgi:hypothetical protein